jgi:hypothetical protein
VGSDPRESVEYGGRRQVVRIDDTEDDEATVRYGKFRLCNEDDALHVMRVSSFGQESTPRPKWSVDTCHVQETTLLHSAFCQFYFGTQYAMTMSMVHAYNQCNKSICIHYRKMVNICHFHEVHQGDDFNSNIFIGVLELLF